MGRIAAIANSVRGYRGSTFVGCTLAWLIALAALQPLWPTPKGVVVQGIVLGSLTGLMAISMSLIYRINGIINFAQADLGVLPTVLGLSLLTYWSWPYAISLPISLVAAGVLGLAVEFLVIRRFSNAPRLILTVATIGLAQVLFGLGLWVPTIFTDEQASLRLYTPKFTPPFDFSFEIHPIVFDSTDVLTVVAVPVIIFGLMTFLRHTPLGTAVRACAQRRDRASLVGINVGQAQNLVWGIAAVLAAIAMILRAGKYGLPLGATFAPAILLRALTAAALGRMENYTVMFAGATFLGVLETAILWNEDDSALIYPVIFVVVVGIFAFQRWQSTRADRQTTGQWREVRLVREIPRELAKLPEVDWVQWFAKVIGIGFLLWLPFGLGDGDTNFASAVMIFSIIAVSMVILTGWAGEVSLGQMGFVGIGAAAGAVVNFHFQLDLILTLVVAGVMGAALSIVVGLPALRIRGLFLTVTTLAFALVVSSYFLDEKRFSFLPDNSGERVRRLPLFGRIDILSETAFYYVSLAVLFAVLVTVGQLRRSRTSRVMIAVRDNETAAQAFGISPTRVKLMAFAISGFYASLAGGLFTLHQQALGQSTFAPTQSIRVLTMVVIGGLGSVPGAVLGAVYLKATEFFGDDLPRDIRDLWLFATSGLGLLGVLIFLQGGLSQLVFSIRDRLLQIAAFRRGIILPSLFGISLSQSSLEGAEEGVSERKRVRPAARRDAAGVFRWFPSKPAPEIDYFTYPDMVAVGETAPALLSVRSIDVYYGQIQVLFGVNIEIQEGDIVALLGTNGAGKSTVLRAVSGLTAPEAGTIAFEGENITGLAPHRIAELGIVQVPGEVGVFPLLSVAENLALGGWLYHHDRSYMDEATAHALELFPSLADRLGEPATNLSGGQQQMLTLAMAFMAKPRLLLIDELSRGLAPIVVEELLSAIRQLNAEGVTVVIVEQSVNVALSVADTAFFMEKGEVRYRGPTAELLEQGDVLRSVFLGADDRQIPSPSAPRTGQQGTSPARPPRLEIVNVSKSFSGNLAVDGVSLTVEPGEIVGILGPNGAGKSTLFELISGFEAPDGGKILFNGIDLAKLSPARRARLGVSHSFQDSKLFGSLTVEDVLKVALDRTLQNRDPVATALGFPGVRAGEAALQKQVDQAIEVLGLTRYRDVFASELSTGTRRIVDLACQAALIPGVILFDEPSSGIAQREAEALPPLLKGIRNQTNAGVLLIDHDMGVLAHTCDRVLVMHLGKTIREGTLAEVLADPAVVAAYLGEERTTIERSGPTSSTLLGASRTV